MKNTNQGAYMLLDNYRCTVNAIPEQADREMLRSAIVEYLCRGTEPQELSPIANVAWTALKPSLEAGRYQDGRKLRKRRPDTKGIKLDAVLLYADYEDVCAACPDPEVAREVRDAIWQYAIEGQLPDGLSEWAQCIMSAVTISMDFTRHDVIKKMRVRNGKNIFDTNTVHPPENYLTQNGMNSATNSLYGGDQISEDRSTPRIRKIDKEEEKEDDEGNARACARAGARACAREGESATEQNPLGDHVTDPTDPGPGKKRATSGETAESAEGNPTVTPGTWDSRHVPPTETEVLAYAMFKGVKDFPGTKFIKYYNNKQWTYGHGTPIIDWTLSVDQWIERERPKQSQDAEVKRAASRRAVTDWSKYAEHSGPTISDTPDLNLDTDFLQGEGGELDA